MNIYRIAAMGLMLAAASTAAAAGASAGGSTAVRSSCRATYDVADAKALALATPNARAFVQNFGAKLSTELDRSGSGTVAIRVTANDPKQGRVDVGVYTVSLRTGAVTDDDQEPAEDRDTAEVRAKLLARHCSR
jgi:hypothetical protein